MFYVFTAHALTKLLHTCYSNPNYTAGIIFSTKSKSDEFRDTMRTLIKNNEIPGTEILNHRPQSKSYIRFKNGSKIETLLYSKENVRGRNYHQVLVDDTIPQVALDNIYSMTKDYMFNECDIPDGTEELDEFLNGFKVI